MASLNEMMQQMNDTKGVGLPASIGSLSSNPYVSPSDLNGFNAPIPMPMMQGQDSSVPMPMMQGQDPSVPMPMMPRPPIPDEYNDLINFEGLPAKNANEIAAENETAQATAQAIEALTMELQKTQDPDEQKFLMNMIENTNIKANAPYTPLMDELSAQAGEDNMMAHVRSGDVNVSKEMLEANPQLENAIGQAAIDSNIDPESMVYGTGIATLHESTGLEQHGWFKKLGKSVKKVAKKIAPIVSVVAPFIPGVGLLASAAISAGTTKLGGGSWKDALKAGVTSYGVGKLSSGIGGLKGGTGAAAGANTAQAAGSGGNFFSRAGEYLTKGKDGVGLLGNLQKGIGSIGEYILPGQDNVGLFGNLGKTVGKGYEYVMPGEDGVGLFGNMMGGGGSDVVGTLDGQPITAADYKNLTAEQIYQIQPVAQGSGGMFQSNKSPMEYLSSKLLPQFAENALGTGPGGYQQTGPGGSQGGGGMSDLLKLGGAGALAAGLGKLAYDEAKNAKGAPVTPYTTMDASGRYNIEAELARRMGQQAPNPVEFGLLPTDALPQLSGGQPRVVGAAEGGSMYPNKGLESLARVAPDVVERMGYNMGGYVMPMAYADGGDVAMEEFERKNGMINGAGTETSDDIPAMLSDGEFVMTGQAVRGAGSYNMNNDSGILTLTPNGAPGRESGTNLMYQLMEAFSGQTTPA